MEPPRPELYIVLHLGRIRMTRGGDEIEQSFTNNIPGYNLTERLQVTC